MNEIQRAFHIEKFYNQARENYMKKRAFQVEAFGRQPVIIEALTLEEAYRKAVRTFLGYKIKSFEEVK